MSRKILITSALPYVNNVPHLGNIIGAVLSADVFARYTKHKGYQTLYVCGSDEHGTTTEQKAKEEGLSPRELCDKYFAIHKEIYDWFNIDFDIFGRTSAPNHIHITQDMFNKVLANGYIEEETVVQPYSTVSQTFLADRFIEGTCPHCGYEDARGDQCDNCGKLLNPQDLINPRSKIDGSTPEMKETKHLFLNLEKLQPELEKWFNHHSQTGGWTSNAIQITKNWFKEGLKKRAISRDLKWGINIPESAYDGRYKDKVFYVWFDAPIGYISITAQHTDAWQDWWKDQNTELYQFMGKDNVPFHSIIFPGSLLAADDGFIKVHHLNSTEYLNYENTKFSKSRGIGVFGTDAKESGIPSDVYRYVLMFYRPENADTQFTWKGLQERLNNELIANFGNLVNRTISFTNRFFEGKVASIDESQLDDRAKQFLNDIRVGCQEYEELLENVKLRDGLNQILRLSSLANQYFQEVEPWKTRNDNPQKAQQDLTLLVNVVKDLAIIAEPYLPATSKEIFSQLNFPVQTFEDLNNISIQDHQLGKAKVLFKKLEDKDRDALQAKYSGKQQEEKQEETGIEPKDVQFTVGQITEIKQHPDADKLYIEQVNLGDRTIQIISGLVPYYKAEELLNKKIFVVENLKPAKMRGEMSHGMLLAAETEDESIVEVLDASDFEVGDKFSDSAKDQITFQDFMKLTLTIKDKQAFINDQPFEIAGKQLKSEKVEQGSIH